MRPSLGESSSQICPRCKGHGVIRSDESLALSILRLIEEEALKENSERIHATTVPVNVAAYLLNEKREAIHQIESRYTTRILFCQIQIWKHHTLMSRVSVKMKHQKPAELTQEKTANLYAPRPTKETRKETPAVKGFCHKKIVQIFSNVCIVYLAPSCTSATYAKRA